MSFLIAFLFNIICKPGTIICGDETQTSLIGNDNNYYYFYDVELKAGSYCYISVDNDTTWFYIEGGSLFYIFPKKKWSNEQFEVIKN
jgi:hypothetical protein